MYIQCDVDVLLERIAKRGRKEEANLDVAFLHSIQRRHDDWLIHRNSSFPVVAPVVVLNGNLPLTQFLRHVQEEDILKFARESKEEMQHSQRF